MVLAFYGKFNSRHLHFASQFPSGTECPGRDDSL
jgi:hypothetical protein